MTVLDVFVPGHPAPQGSKRYVGHGISVEDNKRTKPWRDDVRSALVLDKGTPEARPLMRFVGAVACTLEFIMPRPKSAPKRSTPAADKKPDIDKLIRAVLDAITSAGVIEDDARIVQLRAKKRLAEAIEVPGMRLTLELANQERA